MTLVVDTTTDWSLTTLDVITGALQLCQSIGVGESVSPSDSELCLRALDGLIKEFPIHGFQWPQISSEPVAVAWSVVTPSTVSPPADYFGAPVLKRATPEGKFVELCQVSKAKWELLDSTATGAYPETFYVAPDLTFKLFPAPTEDPGLLLTYQSIMPDLMLTAVPPIQQQFLNSLQYMLADEISLKYGAPKDVRAEIAARATQKKFLMLQWANNLAPLCISVAD
jgi:hypothetical protein